MGIFRRKSLLLMSVILIAALVIGVSAALAESHNALTVADQALGAGDTVVVTNVESSEAGWMVIHADGGGAPGPVIGYAPVAAGSTPSVSVPIDAMRATSRLYAMLHVDRGAAGVYEFPGADVPARDAAGAVVVTPFTLSANEVVIFNQRADDGVVTAARVLSAQQGWLVIHADNGGAPGPVIGQAHVGAGETYNVNVAIPPAAATDTLHAMLHVDAGAPFVYEFPGADVPARNADGGIAMTPFLVVQNAVIATDQYLGADGTVVVPEILADVDGWIVIHRQNETGGIGPVIGHAPVAAGVTYYKQVPVDTGEVTPVLYAMLHVDAGVPGVYEFPGADGPARALDGSVVTPPFNVLDFAP